MGFFIYGPPLKPRVLKARRDRYGVRQYVVRLWRDSLTDLPDVVTTGMLPASIRGTVANMQISDMTGGEMPSGMCHVDITIEGASPGEAQFTQDNPVEEIEGTMEMAGWGTHPGLDWLIKKYGGQLANGKVNWPEYMPGGGGGLGGDERKLNQLYGKDGYLAPGAVYRRTFLVHGAVQAAWFTGVGTLTTAMPASRKFRLNIPGRNWLELMPGVSGRGGVTQVSRRWLLSGLGGHNTDVYSRSLLAGTRRVL